MSRMIEGERAVTEPVLLVEKQNCVATLTLNRPV